MEIETSVQVHQHLAGPCYGPCAAVHQSLCHARISARWTGNVVAYLAPVHCFVDVSLVTRLLPALHKFAGAQIAAMQAEARPSRFMDGSIATLASSIATLQPSGSELLDDMTTQSNTVQQDGYDLDVKVSFVRTEIRTPQVSYSAAALAGGDLRSARQFGLDKRAGVLVVQVQDLEVRSGPSLEDKPRQNVRFAHQQTRARPSDSDAVVTAASAPKRSQLSSAYLLMHVRWY